MRLCGTKEVLLGRTCEVAAVAEVHGLHAFGEQELVNSTCGREGGEREKDTVRKEEASAGLKTY